MAKNMMTHLVAGYPSMEESRRIAEELIKSGAGALEIQFPYSDPMADGPVIQEACQKSLDAGFKLEQGFKMVKDISQAFDRPIYIMSYGGPVYTVGVENYVRRAKEAGARGLIIPDLCIGLDEGLYAAGDAAGMEIVPVLISTVDKKRLEEILDLKPEWIYLVLRRGITGTYTELGEEQITLLKELQQRDVKVYVGFGIQKAEQVEMLAPISAGQIVGSQLVRAIQTAMVQGKDPAAGAGALLKTLLGN
jgi:tryptophan synthase alpha chain